MTWTEVVDQVAARAGLPKAQVRAVLTSFCAVAVEALGRGEALAVPGLGTLAPRELQPRTIRSITDMRRLHLGRRWGVRFRPAAPLRAALGGLAPQDWRQPAHQAAWRLAETLVADLALYHGSRAPGLPAQAGDEAVHAACAGAFGSLWEQVRESYQTQAGPELVRGPDYLAAAARARWAA